VFCTTTIPAKMLEWTSNSTIHSNSGAGFALAQAFWNAVGIAFFSGESFPLPTTHFNLNI
jgi:hypothetical protein